MRRRTLFQAGFCTLSILVFSSGCMSFRTGDLPRISAWPPQPAKPRTTVAVVVSGECNISGTKTAALPQFLEVWRDQTFRAYRDSGLFSDVRSGAVDADLRAEVVILDSGNPNIPWAFISGLTFLIIPCAATDHFTITTTLKDKSGKTLGTFQKSDALTTWLQIVLVVGMPFRFPGVVANEMLYDLNRATLIDACAGKAI
jgi:hypothetical protein